MYPEKTLRKIDMAMLVLLPVMSVCLSIVLRTNFLFSILLFFGMPSLWFSYRTPAKVKKIFLSSLIFAVPFVLVLDYFGTVDGSWFVPTTVFSFRLFGVIPIEDMILSFLLVYGVLIFYEHFLDKGQDQLIDARMRCFLWVASSIALAFVAVVLLRPEVLIIPYAYFWLWTMLILLPALAFLSFFPKLIAKEVITAAYFFPLLLLFEFTGLELGQWSFPGEHFIGWVELLGYRFPFEEFFFWCIVAAIGIVSYYEFFNDDRK